MIRPAQPKDALAAIDLIMIVLKDMELAIFEQLDEKEIKRLLIKAFVEEPDYRYGMNNALIKEINSEVAGIICSYPYHMEKTIDDAFIRILLENNLTEEYKFFDDEETFENEWYLDTLVTSPNFRGQGIASELLAAASDLAKENDFSIVGLNVDKVNDTAKKIYVKNGFKNVGEITISGHQYEHLQKNLTN